MIDRIHLDQYDNSHYAPGRSLFWRATWLFLGQPVFRSSLIPSSWLRVKLLRLFGATVGIGVVIHSEVVVKYPWHLVIGNHCWIGERCWIDNLVPVTLGENVCLSQGVYICTGNHDWSDPAFGLRTSPVTLESSAWAAARSILLPGSILLQGAVASAGSVVRGPISPWTIVAGNPAERVSDRRIRAKHEPQQEIRPVKTLAATYETPIPIAAAFKEIR